MAKYKANWSLEGFKGKSVAPGDVIEAEANEVADFVAKEFGGNVAPLEQAVLTPLAEAKPEPAKSATDPSKLTKDQLVAYALENHQLTLDASATKDVMLAKIAEAKASAAV